MLVGDVFNCSKLSGFSSFDEVPKHLFHLGPDSSVCFSRHSTVLIFIESCILFFFLPARCVCNNTAKILIPPLGSFVSLNPLSQRNKKSGKHFY